MNSYHRERWLKGQPSDLDSGGSRFEYRLETQAIPTEVDGFLQALQKNTETELPIVSLHRPLVRVNAYS
jgi:hypothetical protein